MKQAYRAVALLIALGVVAQASFIALAWFTVIGELEDGAVFTKDSELNLGHELHGMVGMMVIPLLALVLVASSFFTRTAGASKRAGLVLLAVVAQVVLAIVAFSVPAVGPLHGINAMLVLASAIYASRVVRPAAPAAPAEPPAVVQLPAQGAGAERTPV